MTLAERVKECREALGLSQEEAAKKIGIAQQSFHKIEAGKTREPRNIERIAEIFQVSPEWLRFGSGVPPLYLNFNKTTIPKGYVPIVSWSVSNTCKYNMDIVINEHTKLVPLIGKGSLKSFALVIQDDAMVSLNDPRKSFYPGQVIIIDPELTPNSGDFVIVSKEGSSELIFRQYIVDAGTPSLKPLNIQFKGIEIDKAIKIQGVVIAKMENLKNL